MTSFNPTRLQIARERAGLLQKELADRCGVTAQTVSNWETGLTSPSDEDVGKIANATAFPTEFFSGPDIESLPEDAVTMRARTRIPAKKKNAALAAGAMARELAAWIERRFELPAVSLPDLRGQPADLVADVIRAEWMLGDKPIQNMIRILESRGVLVFSLAQDVREIDAFSFWSNGRPVVLLNTIKSAERSRVDAAHELKHLLCDHERTDKREEEEADRFAGALLMPKGDVLRYAPRLFSLPLLIQAKRRYGVSLVAYVYRLRELKLLSDWQYRILFKEMSKRGYRTTEPNPMPERERSTVLPQVFGLLDRQGVKPANLAKELGWSRPHLTDLLFGLGATLLPVDGKGAAPTPRVKDHLKLVD
jgi:Zn-dependent peptidase ImmA (M78 family)/transcriptional regulator with XRE-family HTH domain